MGAQDAFLFVLRQLFKLCLVLIQVFLLVWILYTAYEIRLYPVKDFGYLIHEFDPWFNYRATEYLAEHGLDEFFKWYDYESWYPIGRPIGTTIYPGMQMTAVAIWEGMKHIPAFSFDVDPTLVNLGKSFLTRVRKFGFLKVPPMLKHFEFAPMSVNDICVMIPAWFGSIAALFCGLLAYEPSRSVWAFIWTAGIMAIIPAGLMRSVAGEFDNEAVAVSAICSTFWLWCRSVRTPSSWPYGILAGISYGYMVAAWGGYIFVLNMVGVHAAMLVALGRFSSGVHKAYSLFFVIGTALAVQIPVVGLQPLRSLEQMGPLLVFMGFQVLAYCDLQRRRQKMETKEFVLFRAKMVVVFGVVLVATAVALWPTGYFGPLSARIRGLFVKHTKTGNPLVDSVAEHQPASPSMYGSYLNLPLEYATLGGVVCLWKRNNACYFVFLYAFIAFHFSGKMSRLVLICAPIVSIACGIWLGFLSDLIIDPFLLLLGKKGCQASASLENGSGGSGKTKDSSKAKNKRKGSPKNVAGVTLDEWDEDVRPGGMAQLKRSFKQALCGAVGDGALESVRKARAEYDVTPSTILRAVIALALVFYLWNLSPVPGKVSRFVRHCDSVARSLSDPQVVYKVRQNDGSMLLVDDYYKGYIWLDKNTPKDSRVMAWWDYGYQITGIGKRTSIADGNTWNHEHIATLGRTLTSPERKAWNVIRHLADYVLVWAGGDSDDMAKSPHLARIGNSVFPDHCGDDDPKCRKFGFYSDESPTPMMAKSLLYKLVMDGERPGVKVNGQLFKEVHKTQHGLMRIYKVMNVSQESKDWVADPKNRVCDAPGSWYCVGQYPPALEPLISKRRSFAQVEDFNKRGDKSAYTKLIEQELTGKKKEL